MRHSKGRRRLPPMVGMHVVNGHDVHVLVVLSKLFGRQRGVPIRQMNAQSKHINNDNSI